MAETAEEIAAVAGPGGAAPDLDAALLAAHAAGDGVRLSRLYAEAAGQAAGEDGAAFFLTHAYVFALEQGLGEADALHARLLALGREE